MTKRSSKDVEFLLCGAVDLTSISRKLEYESGLPVKETTPFGVEAAQFEQSGMRSFAFSGYEGWYDDDEYTATSDLVNAAGDEHVFMLATEGNTQGQTCLCAGGVIYPAFKVMQEQGELHQAAPEFAISGGVDAATIIAALATRSGDLNTEATYVDLGATGGGTTGANLYMSCTELALTGSTNVIISVEDSTNHVDWVAHTAFTALTDVGAEKKVATDLTVNRYLAYKQVFTGLAGTPSCKAVVAIKVNDPH